MAAIKAMNLPDYIVILLLELMYLVLGSIFDTVAAMVLTLPFVYPLVTGMGFDPIWWGVINIVVMEIGMITPPIGINVFVLHGVAKDLPLGVIFRGIVPFLIADMSAAAAVDLRAGAERVAADHHRLDVIRFGVRSARSGNRFRIRPHANTLNWRMIFSANRRPLRWIMRCAPAVRRDARPSLHRRPSAGCCPRPARHRSMASTVRQARHSMHDITGGPSIAAASAIGAKCRHAGAEHDDGVKLASLELRQGVARRGGRQAVDRMKAAAGIEGAGRLRDLEAAALPIGDACLGQSGRIGRDEADAVRVESAFRASVTARAEVMNGAPRFCSMPCDDTILFLDTRPDRTCQCSRRRRHGSARWRTDRASRRSYSNSRPGDPRSCPFLLVSRALIMP